MAKQSLRAVSFYTVLSILLVLYSCAEDRNLHQELKGKWHIVEAIRNGKPTSTLQDAYFDFISDTSMVSNILRIDTEFLYSIEGNRIIQKGDPHIEYQIVKLDTDTLKLKAKINEFMFEFITVKDTSVLN